MEKEKVFSLLKSLEHGNVLTLDNTDGQDFVDTVTFSLNKGLIKQNIGGSYMMDDKGFDLLNGSIVWDSLFPQNNPLISLNNVGNTYSDIKNSNLNIDSTLKHTNTNNIKVTSKAKKKWYDISMWIFAAIMLLLALWEFFSKPKI